MISMKIPIVEGLASNSTSVSSSNESDKFKSLFISSFYGEVTIADSSINLKTFDLCKGIGKSALLLFLCSGYVTLKILKAVIA